MTLTLLSDAELPAELRMRAAALDCLDQDPPYDYRLADRAARLGYPFADPRQLLAVEDGQVLGRVGCLALDVVTSEGSARALGIVDVVADPAHRGRGIATTLLTEVHRRAAAQGYRYALLWTHPSWGAHTVYERLGYVDLFSPPVAIRPPGPVAEKLPAGYGLRPVRAKDGPTLDALLPRSRRGRWGVLPRRRPFILRFGFLWRAPKDYRQLTYRGRTVGYLNAARHRSHVSCDEAVPLPPHRRALFAALDAVSRRHWTVVQRSTWPREAAAEFARRGYVVLPQSHQVLMGAPLDRRARVATLLRMTRDPRFTSQGGDMF